MTHNFTAAKSMAEQLAKHDAVLIEDYINLAACFLKLLKENTAFREALKFYGNEMNYSTDDYRGVSGEMIYRCILYSDMEERNEVYCYAGKRARAVLEKHREKM